MAGDGGAVEGDDVGTDAGLDDVGGDAAPLVFLAADLDRDRDHALRVFARRHRVDAVAGEGRAEADEGIDRLEERIDLPVADAAGLVFLAVDFEDHRRIGAAFGRAPRPPGQQLERFDLGVLLVLFHQGDDVGVVHALLAVGQRDEPLVERLLLLGGELVAELLQARAEARAPGVLAHHQARRGPADRFGRHDLVGRTLLDHAILMDAGLVREGVDADDRLVRRDRDAGAAADQRTGRADPLGADAGLVARVVVAPRAEGHHDLFERGVARALADAVDRDLDLPHARLDRGDRVGGRHAEVVVVVGAVDDLVGVRQALPDVLAHGGEHRRALVGQGVADGVGQVDRPRPGAYRHLDRPAEVVDVGAGGVHRRPLDVGDGVAGVADHLLDPHQGLVARHPHLMLQVDVGGGEEDVQHRVRRRPQRLDGGVDVHLDAAGERGDGDIPALLGDRPDRVQVAGRGDREAGLDDVHPEVRERLRDLQFLFERHRRPRRLLAIAQRRIEDPDPRACRFGHCFPLWE